MILVQIIYKYRDKKLRDWLVYKEKLPKKRGEWQYWVGDCSSKPGVSTRGTSKKEVLDTIKKLETFK